jgi:hypothetical protein
MEQTAARQSESSEKSYAFVLAIPTPETAERNTPNYFDLYARDKWFYQAIGASPAMFKRDTTAGSLYWLALRDNTDVKGETTELYFGPSTPNGKEGQWIQTIPGKGWFVYFRVYGPEKTRV